MQVMACRLRHADVLEWLWFLNSHQAVVSDWMWGDKDTFRLAFALAGKEEDFWQVCMISVQHYSSSCKTGFAFATMLNHA